MVPEAQVRFQARSRDPRSIPGSGDGVSVLLRQPNGFEGLPLVPEVLEPDDFPVTKREDERGRYLDLDTASLAAKSSLS